MADSSVLDRRTSRAPRATDLPARFRERVLAALPGEVDRIVLVGSQARGEAHGGSDGDFAVFLAREPTEEDRRRIGEIGHEIWQEFDAEVQTLLFAGSRWLARNELACNIRDYGFIIHGSDDAPVVERPVLEHALDALSKAERFAELALETPDHRFEGVVHGSYYAMFHAARAALLMLEGSSSTNHGRFGGGDLRAGSKAAAWLRCPGLRGGFVRSLQAPRQGRLRQPGSDRGGTSPAGGGGAVPRVRSRPVRPGARLRHPASRVCRGAC
jgi:predicted nucleotidyltransferase